MALGEKKGENVMKFRCWMVAKAVIVGVFGIGFALFPVWLGSIYGMDLSPSGALMARLFAAGFIFEGIVLYLARNLTRSDVAARAIMLGVVVSNAIGCIACIVASVSGVWNALGWLSVALYLVFGLGFAYFYFLKK